MPMDDKVCVVGIDPGTKKLGWCALTLNAATNQIEHIHVDLVRVDKLPLDETMVNACGELHARIQATIKLLMARTRDLRPQVIGYESPYFNPMTPSAYAALVELSTHFRQAVFDDDPQMWLINFTPSMVKLTVGAKGNANKDEVRERFMERQDIVSLLSRPACALDDNEVDSVIIAVTAAKYWITHQLR